MAFTWEPHFRECFDGQTISIRATLIAKGATKVFFKTDIFGQPFFADAGHFSDIERYNLLGVTIHRRQGVFWIDYPSSATIISRPVPSLDSLTVVETCAGLGAMGHGYTFCGAETVAYNELNPRYAQCLRNQFAKPVITGDMNDTQVLSDVLKHVPFASILSSGVACQPFSQLGDQQAERDSRSTSLTGTLNMAYHLEPIWIILECTKEIKQSEWAQGILSSFCQHAHYVMSQQILDLHHLWPGHRTRWWAVLTKVGYQPPELQPLPALPFDPCIVHLTPSMLHLDPETLSFLELDEDELVGFNSSDPRGISKHYLNTFASMPTATHSWGSQLRQCDCGCRSRGFSSIRLEQRGLYGQLMPLGEDTSGSRYTGPRARHLHAREVALWSGLDPRFLQCKHPALSRLELSGVGQLASPIQSGWILAQALSAAGHLPHLPDPKPPMDVLHNILGELFEGRNTLWNPPRVTRSMQIFESAVAELFCPSDEPSLQLDQLILAEIQSWDNADTSLHRAPNEQSSLRVIPAPVFQPQRNVFPVEVHLEGDRQADGKPVPELCFPVAHASGASEVTGQVHEKGMHEASPCFEGPSRPPSCNASSKHCRAGRPLPRSGPTGHWARSPCHRGPCCTWCFHR
eukprot:Skav221895  [mRNA]  locus=scaffold1395:702164:704056:+ [translate_table: standard]